MLDTQKSEHAKRCIRTLEQIRRYTYKLSRMTKKLHPKASLHFSNVADELKDWREVLEEFIPEDYDEGK